MPHEEEHRDWLRSGLTERRVESYPEGPILHCLREVWVAADKKEVRAAVQKHYADLVEEAKKGGWREFFVIEDLLEQLSKKPRIDALVEVLEAHATRCSEADQQTLYRIGDAIRIAGLGRRGDDVFRVARSVGLKPGGEALLMALGIHRHEAAIPLLMRAARQLESSVTTHVLPAIYALGWYGRQDVLEFLEEMEQLADEKNRRPARRTAREAIARCRKRLEKASG